MSRTSSACPALSLLPFKTHPTPTMTFSHRKTNIASKRCRSRSMILGPPSEEHRLLLFLILRTTSLDLLLPLPARSLRPYLSTKKMTDQSLEDLPLAQRLKCSTTRNSSTGQPHQRVNLPLHLLDLLPGLPSLQLTLITMTTHPCHHPGSCH